MQIIENAVAGKRYVSSSTRRVPVFNPATGEQSAELPLSTMDELNEPWPPPSRRRCLGRDPADEARPRHVQVQGAARPICR
jgi:hypothetical protein